LSGFKEKDSQLFSLGTEQKRKTQAGQSLKYNFLSKGEGDWSRPIFHIYRITHLAFSTILEQCW
jgi:hypothetical protein